MQPRTKAVENKLPLFFFSFQGIPLFFEKQKKCRAFHSNLFCEKQKRISVAIPNAAKHSVIFCSHHKVTGMCNLLFPFVAVKWLHPET